MSTLKTHNLQSPDAGSVNIALTPNAGMVVAGVTTFSGFTHIKTAVINTAYQTIESTATNSYPYLRLKNDAREYQLSCHGGQSDSFNIYDGTAAAYRFTITSSGNVGINESSPGQRLTIGGDIQIGFNTPNDAGRQLNFNVNRGSAGQTLANINWQWNSKFVAQIRGIAGADTTNKDDGHLAFFTSAANSLVERLRIRSGGDVVINNSTGSLLEMTRTSTNTSGLCGKVVFGNTDWDSSMASVQAYQDGGNDNASLRFYTQASAGGGELERLRITSGGKFGFGTSSPDQTVHIHKGSAGSVSSTANTVLTLENSTTNILQFLNPNTAAAQVRFGDPQDDGAGFIEYSHSANTMSFGTNGPTRMQIDSNGHLGIAVASVTQLANSKQLTLRPSDDDGIRFVRPGDGNNNPNVHLDLTTTTSGSAYPTGEAYTVKYRTYNCDQIFETYEGGGTGGHIAFKTAPQGGTTTERLTIHKNGGLQINSIGNVSAFTPTTSGITGGLVLTTPVYSEYHYTWSGHSSYTIDLTCASYFHAEFIYVQHQTNGGTGMHHYVRGKWANNHQTHTCIIHEYSGDGAGLDVSFVASDQSGNGSINGESNMTGRGAGGDGYTNGGGENYANTSSANGRLRITETYNWGSVSSRGLIVRVFFGSFNISKS